MPDDRLCVSRGGEAGMPKILLRHISSQKIVRGSLECMSKPIFQIVGRAMEYKAVGSCFEDVKGVVGQ